MEEIIYSASGIIKNIKNDNNLSFIVLKTIDRILPEVSVPFYCRLSKECQEHIGSYADFHIIRKGILFKRIEQEVIGPDFYLKCKLKVHQENSLATFLNFQIGTETCLALDEYYRGITENSGNPNN